MSTTAEPLKPSTAKRSRCSSPESEQQLMADASPRKQRIEVREQEKASIMNCSAIQLTSGFTSLSSCDQAMFDKCQDGKAPTLPSTPLTSEVVPDKVQTVQRTRHVSTMLPPPRCHIGLLRRTSKEGSSGSPNGDDSEYSLGREEIEHINARSSIVKNPMRPTSSRGGRSSSFSMVARTASLNDIVQTARDVILAKNQTDLKHSHQKIDAYTTHVAALERVCREAGLPVPILQLPPSPNAQPPKLHSNLHRIDSRGTSALSESSALRVSSPMSDSSPH